jgi:succinate dehydrogenase / fumarate reductase cytochrome b subunit
VIYGFQQWPVALVYIVAMALLCMHLNHGISSMFQTLGFAHPHYTPRIKAVARTLSLLYFAGFSSIPLAVLLGVLSPTGPTRL